MVLGSSDFSLLSPTLVICQPQRILNVHSQDGLPIEHAAPAQSPPYQFSDLSFNSSANQHYLQKTPTRACHVLLLGLLVFTTVCL